MLKSLVFILAIILSFSASSQYSQNIDTLSNKELKKLLLNQPFSKKAHNLMGLSQDLELLSIIGYSAGGILMFGGMMEDSIYGVAIMVYGGIVSLASLILFTGPSKYFKGRAKKAYNLEIPYFSNETQSYLRNEVLLLKSQN